MEPLLSLTPSSPLTWPHLRHPWRYLHDPTHGGRPPEDDARGGGRGEVDGGGGGRPQPRARRPLLGRTAPEEEQHEETAHADQQHAHQDVHHEDVPLGRARDRHGRGEREGRLRHGGRASTTRTT